MDTHSLLKSPKCLLVGWQDYKAASILGSLLTTYDTIRLWPHVISWRNPYSKIGFALTIKRVGWRRWVGIVHMMAALAGCRMSSVSTGQTPSHLVSTNRCKSCSSPLVGALFLALRYWQFLVRRSICWSETPTIESSLMSKCGQGHEPPEIASK